MQKGWKTKGIRARKLRPKNVTPKTKKKLNHIKPLLNQNVRNNILLLVDVFRANLIIVSFLPVTYSSALLDNHLFLEKCMNLKIIKLFSENITSLLDNFVR